MGLSGGITTRTQWAFLCVALSLVGIVSVSRANGVALSSPLRAGRIAAGNAHTCAIATDGAVWCWGDNTYGQLGSSAHASLASSRSRVPVRAATLPGGRVAQRIASGNDHVCVVADDGPVWCWGRNGFGELGIAGGSQPDPVQVVLGATATLVAAGGNTTCAVLSTNAVKCWGKNNRGQLGNGTTTALATSTPATVTSIPSQFSVDSLDVGALHTCATSTSGDTWCWGAYDDGRLGTTGASDVLTPQRISTLTAGASSYVATGADHSCVVVGSLAKCFGANTYGQLGSDPNSLAASANPVSVGFTSSADVRVLSGGADFTCAVLVTNAVECFGINNDGQLGDSTTTSPRHTPQSVSGLTANVVDVALGTSHACAVLDTGVVKCWGANIRGQVGDNSTATERTSAVVVGTLNIAPPTTTIASTTTVGVVTTTLAPAPPVVDSIVPGATQATTTTVVSPALSGSGLTTNSGAARTLRVRRNRFITARTIASHVSLTIPKTSQGSMRFTIVSGLRNCTFVGTKVKALRAGTCKVLVTLIPKRGTRTLKTAKIVVS